MTTYYTQSWEQNLLSLAGQASSFVSQSRTQWDVAPELLESAYDYCRSITSIHSRSFYLSSSLLPKPKRRAARALYAFCRVSDDIVDRHDDNTDPLAELSTWQQRVMSPTPLEDDLVAIAWTDARTVYNIPITYAEQLIDGVARDLTQTRYGSFADLASYCYGVASTVGLMSMHITGYTSEEAIPYAIKLGVALQLTNILRDIGEDWRSGRVYLPQDELAEFGLTEDDLDIGKVTPAWRDFMRFQIDRNRRLYAEALPGVSMLDTNGRFAIAASAELYRGILVDIEDHDYDVFSRRSSVSTVGKLRKLPGIWLRSRNGYQS